MLMLFHGLYKVGSINKALVCSSVQPSEALTQQFHIQSTIFQINAVQISDFEFAARRRFQVFSKFDHTVIIEVQTSHAVVTLRMFWLFLNRNGLTVLVKLNNTESLRIVHIVAKHGCTFSVFCFFHCCI